MRIFFFFSLLFSFFTAPLQSEEEAPLITVAQEQVSSIDSPVGEQSYNYWKSFVNMIVTLLFLISCVLISTWFLKKILRSRLKISNSSNAIKIIERRALHPKASLYLIDILGKGVVVGESAQGLSLITEFPLEMDVQELIEREEEQQEKKEPFSFVLQKKIKALLSRNATSG